MKKLYRKRNSTFGGVCAGIGNYLEVDETLVRIFFLILMFSPFPIVITYILMWMIVPKEPEL